jgi:monoamine oxidase
VTADTYAAGAGFAGLAAARRLVRAGRIASDPPAPLAHRDLPERPLPGANIRAHTRYPQPFWRSGGPSGQPLDPHSPAPITTASPEPATHMHGRTEGAVRSGEPAAGDVLVAT